MVGWWVALVLCGGPLFGQTDGMVRAASVAYHAQRQGAQLAGPQRREADRLEEEALREAREGRFGEALRRYAHGTAIVRNAAWTPAVEFAWSLDAHVDHVMLEPGRPVRVSLAALYPSGRTGNENLIASVFLVATDKGGPREQALARGAPMEPAGVPFTTRITLPKTTPGNYYLEIRLTLPDGKAPRGLSDIFTKSLAVHIENLSGEIERLRAQLAKISRSDSPALATAEYALQFYERVDHGAEGLRRYAAYPFREELARASLVVDDLEGGREPFAGRRGDFHRAYRSAVDRTLQPYRLLIPDSYDGTRPVPLLVALHGAGGDENDFFDLYPEAPLQPEAQRVGFLVVCPGGRGPNSGYRGAAEQDVFDVLAEVERDYRVDPERIYLMGHSMGAFATWRLAMAHPDRFAALGLIAGGGDPAGIVKIRHIPQYVVHGAKDPTVAVGQSRAMVEAGRKAGASIVYIEVPGAGHYDAVVGQFGLMLDFFARQAKQAR